MTLLKPTLQVRRLKIMQGGSTAFDENFRSGINIIRGHNSSGKTTILDFLAYSLGSENIAWKPEALLCDTVLVEILANGVPITLQRPVSDRSQNPMQIFWGTLQDAENAPTTSWQLFPFRRSERKESFSQTLFRALEMPEVRGAAESNITLHQILRLLYADQRSPHDTLFRPETFDTVLTRETVGGYLFGIYDDRLYAAQLEQRAAETNLGQIAGELRNIFSVLGRSGQDTNFEWIGSEITRSQQEQDELSQRLKALKETRGTAVEVGKDPGVVELRRRLSEAKSRLVQSEDSRARLELEIEDSRLFVAELERRLENLDDSGITREYLGTASFAFCPSCLSPIESLGEESVCALCKAPLGERTTNSQLLRMRNELQLQREESARLLEARRVELTNIVASMPQLKSELSTLEKDYARQSATWSSALESDIEALAKKLGETGQRIRQLLDFQRLGSVVLDLQKKREELAARLEQLKTEIERLEFAQDERKKRAKALVAERLVSLLRKDVPRQQEFIDASECDWNFNQNRVTVNGQHHFSESSMVILRHSFHLAVLFASAHEPFFRVPRFLILDGIDDGGLELNRNHSFQKLIVETSQSLENDHQIIFATSQIEPTLEQPELVVGRAYTPEHKSLEVR